jgi:alpha-L-fucosidase
MIISRRALIGAAASSAIVRPRSALAMSHHGDSSTTATLQASYVARKLGIFLHFSMFTFFATDPIGQPESAFAPSALSIDNWITNIVAAKATYACLTAKHDDGFCLWNTSTTTHNVMNSPVASDIVASFTTKCRAAGIMPVLYLSIGDAVVGGLGLSQAQYLTYMQTQITELLTNYGSIGALWLDDGFWNFGTYFPWASDVQMMNYIRSQQRDCLIANNSHVGNLSDTDIVEFEIGGNGPVPSNNTFPAEVVETAQQLNGIDTWFWRSSGQGTVTLKSASTLIANLATYNARGATYMINFPPDTTGNIPASEAAVMAALGSR